MEFERYPMWMKHPNHRPAVISDDYEGGANRGAQYRHHAKPGVPEQFPAVMVNNPDQESYYAARGYVAQGGDAKSFERAQIAPLPKSYRHHEYPRIVNGLVEQDPNAPEPETNEYPKWVRPEGKEPQIVRSRQEEDEVMRGSTRHEPVKRAEPSEIENECLAAIMAAANGTVAPDARAELCAKAAEMGIKFDKRWGEKKLRQAIEQKEAA